MSENSMRKWIENRLIDNMAVDHPTVGVKIPNVKFDPGSAYVCYYILGGESQQITLGESAQIRHVGVIQFDAFVEQDTGLGTLNDLADYLGSLFQRTSGNLDDGDRLVLRTPVYKYMGEDDGYSRKVVTIPFYRDEASVSVQTF